MPGSDKETCSLTTDFKSILSLGPVRCSPSYLSRVFSISISLFWGVKGNPHRTLQLFFISYILYEHFSL